MEHLNSAAVPSEAEDRRVRSIVEEMRGKIREGRVRAALGYAKDLDGWDAALVPSDEKNAALIAQKSVQAKAGILAGPGNAFVTETKCQLFGEVGTDAFASRSKAPSLEFPWVCERPLTKVERHSGAKNKEPVPGSFPETDR